MRTTWIVHNANSGTPIPVYLEAAGIQPLDRSYDVGDVRNPRVYGDFVGFGGCGSIYFSPIGRGRPMSSNARRWMVVGVASVGMVGVFCSVP